MEFHSFGPDFLKNQSSFAQNRVFCSKSRLFDPFYKDFCSKTCLLDIIWPTVQTLKRMEKSLRISSHQLTILETKKRAELKNKRVQEQFCVEKHRLDASRAWLDKSRLSLVNNVCCRTTFLGHYACISHVQTGLKPCVCRPCFKNPNSFEISRKFFKFVSYL